ncbi:MAG: efflux RND transporter periplasmic adaptor subunit [Ferrovum sp.]|nr:efflux RND transporter periplasmic adaptor subunit [Ferrovum sp.]NDU87189.1 efflux RND transporter periplasmic adaptor subunit [Ferrovum sp.]
MNLVKVNPVTEQVFVAQREALGTVAFDDDLTVQVFPPYPGKIFRHLHEVGDSVRQGEALYTLTSPDLVQAESTLISTAGVRELTTHALERAKALVAVRGLAEKDYQQAVSDQQAAEGAYQAARKALWIFGKTEVELDRILSSREVDSVLSVPSPLTGRVTVVSMAAAVGTFVQPGTAPAPYGVSDLSTLWLLANVAEGDIPRLHLGAAVEVHVAALPGRVFQGRIDKIGAAVDPGTHRIQVRTVLHDPKHELYPGMMATFVIRTGGDMHSVGLPLSAVVREGDGSYSAWVATGAHHFVRRSVQVGQQQGDTVQILTGIQVGEKVATEGAIFLSNALAVRSASGD